MGVSECMCFSNGANQTKYSCAGLLRSSAVGYRRLLTNSIRILRSTFDKFRQIKEKYSTATRQNTCAREQMWRDKWQDQNYPFVNTLFARHSPFVMNSAYRENVN